MNASRLICFLLKRELNHFRREKSKKIKNKIKTLFVLETSLFVIFRSP